MSEIRSFQELMERRRLKARPYSLALQEFKRSYFSAAIVRAGSVTKAAQACGVTRTWAQRMVTIYDIDHPRRRPARFGNAAWHALGDES